MPILNAALSALDTITPNVINYPFLISNILNLNLKNGMFIGYISS